MIRNETENLLTRQLIHKLYGNATKEACAEYDLNQLEANVLAFFYLNPSCYTAQSVVDLRGYSKGNVSRAVDTLVSKKLLERSKTDTNRREIRLVLTEEGKHLGKKISKARDEIESRMMQGISQKDLEAYEKVCHQIYENLKIRNDSKEANNYD